MTREEVTAAIGAAKAAKKVTWQEIAREVGKSSVWTTSVCLGQNRTAVDLEEVCPALASGNLSARSPAADRNWSIPPAFSTGQARSLPFRQFRRSRPRYLLAERLV